MLDAAGGLDCLIQLLAGWLRFLGLRLDSSASLGQSQPGSTQLAFFPHYRSRTLPKTSLSSPFKASTRALTTLFAYYTYLIPLIFRDPDLSFRISCNNNDRGPPISILQTDAHDRRRSLTIHIDSSKSRPCKAMYLPDTMSK